MKVAVAYDEEEMIFQHFGHTERFKLYEIENGEVVSSELVDTAGAGDEALAAFLCRPGRTDAHLRGHRLRRGAGAGRGRHPGLRRHHGPCGLRGGGPAARRPGPRPEPELPPARGRPQLLPRRRRRLLPRVSPVPYPRIIVNAPLFVQKRGIAFYVWVRRVSRGCLSPTGRRVRLSSARCRRSSPGRR